MLSTKGTILVSTAWLLQAQNESQLNEQLASCVGKVWLGHAFGVEPASISAPPIAFIEIKANEFLQHAKSPLHKQSKTGPFVQEFQRLFLFQIRHLQATRHYDQALELLEKMMQNGAASEEVLYRMGHLYRQRFHSQISNQKALEFLDKAGSYGQDFALEIQKEKGLIYMRLHNPQAALKAFEQYKSISTDKKQITWADDMVVQCRLQIQQAK
ncbi:MAG: hypothetical protein AAFV07_12325 [Bacteroidota bacterium]